jgi:hypothetical protein
MNLHVDLILPSEQRSASALNGRALLRLACIAVPSALAAAGFVVFFQVMALQSEVASLEGRWEAARPRKERAVELRTKLATQRRMVAEIKSWQNARTEWHRQLDALQALVPAEIQLRVLRITHSFQVVEKKHAARVYDFVCSGRAEGAEAQQNVETLRVALVECEGLAPRMGDVTVTRFAADSSRGAAKTDRVFDLKSRFEPMLFR